MKKLNVILLTLFLSIVLLAQVNLMAMDEDTVKTEEPKTVVSESTLQVNEGGKTAEELPAEKTEEIKKEGSKEASTPSEEETTKTVDEKVDMGGVPSSNIDKNKSEEPEAKKPSEVKEEKDEKSEEKKDDEAEVKTEEEKKPEETKDAEGKKEEKAKESTEEKTEEKKEEKAEEGKGTETNAKELKAGETLEISELAENPIALGAGQGSGEENVVEVSSFDDLKREIESANNGVKKTIIITTTIEIERTIIIPAGADIVLTSADTTEVKPIGEDKIEMPNDSDDMERRQELVKKAEAKGEKALEDTDLTKNPLPSISILLKRAQNFSDTLIKISEGGKLTIGKDKTDPIFIDGNKDVKTTIEYGSMIDVSGELTMNGGFIANSNNEHDNSAPIYVHDKATFTMKGGRITSNKNISYGINSYNAAGAVYIDEGGKFTLEGGSIDNNEAPVGGVFLGKILNNKNSSGKEPAKFIMKRGYIVNNKGPLYPNLEPKTTNIGGGVNVNSNSEFEFLNGIIAGNEAYFGGAIAIRDNYVQDTDGVNQSRVISKDYDSYLINAKAKYTQNGGLIYKNKAIINNNPNKSGAGGGLYIDSSNASINKGYILKNISENMGGGIYVSIVPHKFELKKTLITENKAIDGKNYYSLSGEGGGYWNCPAGEVDIQDFNSLYIFNNKSAHKGPDIRILKKFNLYFLKAQDDTSNQYEYLRFKTRISPVTEKRNVITYLDSSNNAIEWMYKTKEEVDARAVYNKETINEAWTNSNLFIMENIALKGAGIGSNADIISPGKKGSYEISIEKQWHKDIPKEEIPKSVWIDVFIGDAKYAEIELSEDNDWKATFKDLPFTAEELERKGLKYKVRERSDNFYSVVSESFGDLEVERVFANYIEVYDDGSTYTYDPKPVKNSMKYKIVFIHKDKNGKEVSRKDVMIKQNDNKWSGVVQDMLVGKFKNIKDIKITYHSYDKSYEPDPDWAGLGFNGLDENSKWNGSGPWHEAYILEKEDGGIEIQLPYLWTMYMGNPDGTIDDYYKNTSGYRLSLAPNHRFVITNYPYSEIPVEKNWDESIKKEDIPDSVKVYLLKDGKRFIDKDGKERVITLSKDNGWKGKFEKLPYFKIKGMEFEKYWIKEDSEIFIPLVKVKENELMDINIERKVRNSRYPFYLMQEDYCNRLSQINYIPFEIKYIKDGKIINHVYKNITPLGISDGHSKHYVFKTIIKNFKISGNYKDSDIVIKDYLDSDNEPFSRGIGEFTDGDSTVIRPGIYTIKLVEEDGKLVLYVPKLTPKNMDENLLDVKARVVGNQPYFELTNYYLPKHRIEIEKKWQTYNSNSIPNNLKIKIKGKYVDKEITLTPENWKYFEEFLGKGVLSTNNYEFTEEELANFNGSQAIDTTMEFEAKDKTVKFYGADKKEITKDEFLGLIKGKKYSFELKEAVEDKAEVEIKYDADGNMVIVYPVDVVITEVAQVKFTNTEIPPEPPTPRKTFVRVRKVWQALGETKDIKVELYINGEASGKFLTLNEVNDWSASFTNLDIEDDMGNQYIYTVKEVGEKDKIYTIDERKFEVSYSGDMYEGFTILNKEVPPEEPPTPPEEPEEPEPEPEPPTPTPPTPPEEHIIPKTGVSEDVLGIFLGLMILLGLVYIKKKYILKKSK